MGGKRVLKSMTQETNPGKEDRVTVKTFYPTALPMMWCR